MRLFGTALNSRFGDVEESAVLVAIPDIDPRMKRRFVEGYESVNPGLFQRIAQEA
jgi:hypothetical protein